MAKKRSNRPTIYNAKTASAAIGVHKDTITRNANRYEIGQKIGNTRYFLDEDLEELKSKTQGNSGNPLFGNDFHQRMQIRKIKIPDDQLEKINQIADDNNRRTRQQHNDGTISINRRKGCWRVALGGVNWIARVGGDTQYEGYETLEEALFVTLLLSKRMKSATEDAMNDAARRTENTLKKYTIKKYKQP